MNRKHRLRTFVWVDLFFVNISLLSNITVGVSEALHFPIYFDLFLKTDAEVLKFHCSTGVIRTFCWCKSTIYFFHKFILMLFKMLSQNCVFMYDI